MSTIRARRRVSRLRRFGLLSVTALLAASFGTLANRASALPANPDDIETVAGTAGTAGSADGVGTAASFNQPWDIAVDGAGVAFVTDSANHRIRRIATNGTVSTYAGDAVGTASGYVEGPYLDARFSTPTGIAIDADGALWVADTGNDAIRKLGIDGQVSTVASITRPVGIDIDRGTGVAYVTSTVGNTLYQVTSSGAVTTLATGLNAPTAVSLTLNNTGVLFAEQGGNRIARYFGGVISRYSGDGIYRYRNGSAAASSYAGPNGLAVYSGEDVVIGDTGNSRLRIVVGGNSANFAGNGTVGTADGDRTTVARVRSAYGVEVGPSGEVWFADRDSHTVRRTGVTVSVVSRPTHATTTTTTTTTSTTTSTTTTSTTTTSTSTTTTPPSSIAGRPSAASPGTIPPFLVPPGSPANSDPVQTSGTTTTTTRQPNTTTTTTTRPSAAAAVTRPSTTTTAAPKRGTTVPPKKAPRCQAQSNKPFALYSVVEVTGANGKSVRVQTGSRATVCLNGFKPGRYTLLGVGRVGKLEVTQVDFVTVP